MARHLCRLLQGLPCLHVQLIFDRVVHAMLWTQPPAALELDCAGDVLSAYIVGRHNVRVDPFNWVPSHWALWGLLVGVVVAQREVIHEEAALPLHTVRSMIFVCMRCGQKMRHEMWA